MILQNIIYYFLCGENWSKTDTMEARKKEFVEIWPRLLFYVAYLWNDEMTYKDMESMLHFHL